ncbi:hypothetical protein [Nocardia asteroides]
MSRALRVGPKTVDYIAILTGSTGHVAVDTHIAGFIRAAGVPGGDYRAINALITSSRRRIGLQRRGPGRGNLELHEQQRTTRGHQCVNCRNSRREAGSISLPGFRTGRR